MLLDYELPPHLIAQHPVEPRDASRLMVLHRATGEIEHRHFRDLPEYLEAGDLIVHNDTRVLPARLIGQRERTGGQWEGLFVRQDENGLWEMLTQTRGKPSLGETILIGEGPLRLALRGRKDRYWLVEPVPAGTPSELLHQFGQIPLPPYIRKGREQPEDREHYQTVFARTDGSIAAPTAGLHFTPELLARLEREGIHRASVTLHVGLGTFEPIRSEDPIQHQMHSEWCEVPRETVDRVLECKRNRKRVIAIGSTSTRTLESAVRDGVLQCWQGETNLYIHPPYDFRVVDAIVTNFHLPKTTLLLLVAAFAGSELTRQAYELAVREEYRFFSYGDAMLIV